AVGLVPALPGLMGQPRAAADLFRKQAAFIDVAGGPVDLARYVEPVVSSKYHFAASAISVLESYPAAGLSGTRSLAAPARSSSGVVKYGFSISIPPTSMRGCVLSRLTMIPAPKRSMSYRQTTTCGEGGRCLAYSATRRSKDCDNTKTIPLV